MPRGADAVVALLAPSRVGANDQDQLDDARSHAGLPFPARRSRAGTINTIGAPPGDGTQEAYHRRAIL